MGLAVGVAAQPDLDLKFRRTVRRDHAQPIVDDLRLGGTDQQWQGESEEQQAEHDLAIKLFDGLAVKPVDLAVLEAVDRVLRDILIKGRLAIQSCVDAP